MLCEGVEHGGGGPEVGSASAKGEVWRMGENNLRDRGGRGVAEEDRAK